MTRVYVALGSNVGDRPLMIQAASRRLESVIQGLRLSRIYETEPMYVTDQPRFLNAVCSGMTGSAPRELLAELKSIERELGRVRAVPRGPRSIDLDILLFGTLTVCEPDLRIPHPGIRERPFVLVPLIELAPDIRDPQSGVPYRRYLDMLDSSGVRYFPGSISSRRHGGNRTEADVPPR